MYGTEPVCSRYFPSVFLTDLSVKKGKGNEHFLKITLFLPIKNINFENRFAILSFKYFWRKQIGCSDLKNISLKFCQITEIIDC